MSSPTQTESATIKDQVRSFIVSNYLFGEDRPFAEDESFLQTGLIDSTGILELVHFIEQTFGFTVEDEEMVPENLDSLANVSRYVEGKLGG